MLAFLVLNLSLVAAGQNVSAQSVKPLDFEGNIVLPQYPQLAARAWNTGIFQIEVLAENGSVNTVTVLAFRSTSRGAKNGEPNDSTSMMLQSIKQAVRSWRFQQSDADRFRLDFEFHLVSSQNEPNQPIYTVYRVEQKPLRPPTKIIIEYHFPAINQ